VRITLPDREQLLKIVAQYQPNEDHEAGVEVYALAMEAIKIVIEEFPLYVLVEAMPDPVRHARFFLIDPETSEEKEAPHVMLTLSEDGLPLLCVRAFDEHGGWLSDANYNLMSMSSYFACHASVQFGEVENLDSESRANWRRVVARRTADMLQAAFARLEAQIQITATSFLKETAWNLGEFWFDRDAELFGLDGLVINRVNFQKLKEQRSKEHHKAIQTLWEDMSPASLLNNKKQLLALYYEQTFAHWKEMQRMQLEGKDWQQYVRAVPGITDDLVHKFEKDCKISDLAIEHAARRAELYNVYDAKPKAVEERKRGNHISGYGKSRLFELRKEGWELLRQKGLSPSGRS